MLSDFMSLTNIRLPTPVLPTHRQFMYDFMLGHTSSERVRMLVKEDDWERECSEFMHVEMW